jgi:hypothetical protein
MQGPELLYIDAQRKDYKCHTALSSILTCQRYDWDYLTYTFSFSFDLYLLHGSPFFRLLMRYPLASHPMGPCCVDADIAAVVVVAVAALAIPGSLQMHCLPGS